MRRSQHNNIFYSLVRSLLLLVTIMFGKSLPAMGLVGSNPLPTHFLYAGKLAEPELPNPFRGRHKML
ncbi:hypothetical protein, partial [Endozoicomonas sp. SESOKO4]|uniref:hypothetical protein n=1 Tax=Endozoicomonas sp. SESOKO4 TaxID=2828745 RepID=UPI002148E41C